MENLNKYQKVQIALLILIVIAAAAFVRTLLKNQSTKNLATKQTSIGATEITEEVLKDEDNTLNEEEIEEDTEDTSWDEENVEDTKVDVEEEEKKKEDNKTQYYIKVNYGANCVTVYKKDDSGNYTIPVKALICSTGKATPTSGVYKTSDKYRWHQLNGGVYGQYCTRITGHILFHSVPCSSNTPDSLKYVAYDKLGTKASAGCVRLTVEGAMWIYNNCASGTYVEFYSSSNPGPLGKPTARKISSNVACRNWDPTDPDPRNPWHTYVEPASTQAITEEPKTEQSSGGHSTEQEQNKQESNQEINKNNTQEQNKTEEIKQEENKENNTKQEEKQNITSEPEKSENTTKNTTTENNTTTEEQTKNET